MNESLPLLSRAFKLQCRASQTWYNIQSMKEKERAWVQYEEDKQSEGQREEEQDSEKHRDQEG